MKNLNLILCLTVKLLNQLIFLRCLGPPIVQAIVLVYVRMVNLIFHDLNSSVFDELPFRTSLAQCRFFVTLCTLSVILTRYLLVRCISHHQISVLYNFISKRLELRILERRSKRFVKMSALRSMRPIQIRQPHALHILRILIRLVLLRLLSLFGNKVDICI